MRDESKALGRYGTVGLDFVLSILLGFFGGRWLDGKLGTHWIQLVGFFFGVAAGFRSIYDAAQRMRRDTESEDARDRARRGLPTERPDDDDGPG